MYDKNIFLTCNKIYYLCQNGGVECLARYRGGPLAFRDKIIHRAVIDFQLLSTYATIKYKLAGPPPIIVTSSTCCIFIATSLINSKKVIDKILSEN